MTAPTFQVGDVVECVDGSFSVHNGERLALGRRYTVTGISSEVVFVDDGSDPQYPYRFRLVSRPTTIDPAVWLSRVVHDCTHPGWTETVVGWTAFVCALASHPHGHLLGKEPDLVPVLLPREKVEELASWDVGTTLTLACRAALAAEAGAT